MDNLPPPPPAKSKTQEVTSVMQESQVVRTLKAQKSLTSTAICDHDGDDRHCPPITPQKHNFYIRTGTPMSCANSGAVSFLSRSGVSFLNINEADIIDKRSTSNLLFRSDRSEEHRAQFPGNARVKFSLVAWTTVESKDQNLDIEELNKLINKYHFWETAPSVVNAETTRKRLEVLYNSQWHQIFKFSIIKEVSSRFKSGDYLKNLFHEFPGLTQKVNDALQKSFIKHFKKRQKGYNDLDAQGVKKANRRNNILSRHHPANITVLPPLSGKVHTIAYDDDVIANAGEALLKCIDQTPEKDSPTFFDAKLSDDQKVCLSSAQWRMKKIQENPGKIATRNKKLLYQYFKHVYGSKGTLKPWKGAAHEDGTIRPVRALGPKLVYSTHFAVQSCKDYAYDNTSDTETKTADQVIKELKKEIENIETLIDSNQTINAENSKLYQLFETYVPTDLDSLAPHPPSNSREGFNGRKTLLQSIFFGLFVFLNKYYNKYRELKEVIEESSGLGYYNNRQILKMIDDVTQHALRSTSLVYDDYRSSALGKYALHFEINTNLWGYLASYASCNWAKAELLFSLKRKLIEEKNKFDGIPNSDNGFIKIYTQWYNNQERDIVDNIITYSPKWWEHTDLGYSCRLLAKGIEDMVPPPSPHGKNMSLPEPQRSENLPAIVDQNITAIEQTMEALKVVIGLEILEEQYQHQGPKNKTCSPNTETDQVNEEATPPTPKWHNMYSSAVLDMRQDFKKQNLTPFKIFSSEHPAKNLSSDEVKKYLMTKDPRYITFYSSSSKFEENYHPGLPMIFIPGLDYVAPEIVADATSSPPRSWSGKHGISVYSYPPATCAPSSVTLKKERPRRLWN